MIDIYAYDDFRKLLSDLYEERRKEIPTTTARTFAAAARFSNPGFYHDVIRGARGLSREALSKIIAVYGFNGKQSEYFRLLVEYGQEKNAALREEVRQRLVSRRSRSRFARLQPEKARYYEDIAYPLVRTSVDAGHFCDEEDAVTFWKGRIPAIKVRHCLQDLLEWGLVRRSSMGFLDVVDKFVEPASTLGMQVRRLNREWIREGEKALDSIPPEDRHISTMLLSIGPETQKKILDRIRTFREELFSIAEKDGAPDRVVQLSLLYFPQGGGKHNA